MVGCFGLSNDHCHTRVPLDRLIESHARLDATMLNRIGGLVDGAVTQLKWGDRGYQLATHRPNLWINGNRVLVVWTDWALPWFECPRCGRRCRHIFLDELACRICLRLDYASRHLHRQMPGVHRIARLRLKLGADPHPFAPLPERPKHHVRYHRIVARISNEEAKLVGHLQTVTHDLERRIRIRKARGEW
jgi:hypothetical protein